MSVQTTHSGPIPPIALPRLPSGKVDVDSWTRQLGVGPIHDLKELSSAGVWPDDESVDDFQAARRLWRAEGQSNR